MRPNTSLNKAHTNKLKGNATTNTNTINVIPDKKKSNNLKLNLS